MYWQDMVGNRWVEVDGDAISYNFDQVRNLLDEKVKIIGVVKANAYGLGAIEVAKILEHRGITMVAVTTVEEGAELREAGVNLPILILTPFLPNEAYLIVKYSLTPAVSNLEQIDALAKHVKIRGLLEVHIKIETGMGRTGIRVEGLAEFLEGMKKYPEIYVQGMFTHFAQARQGDAYTQSQFTKFQEAMSICKLMEIDIPLKHVCNSAGTLDLPEMHLDAVRVGTLLYGQCPAIAKRKISLRDPWQLKARVIQVTQLGSGESVGYGREYIARGSKRIAVLPLGTADGLTVSPLIKPKSFDDLVRMIVKLILEFMGKGKTSTIHCERRRFKLVGRLGMQLSMAEVDDHIMPGSVVAVSMRRLCVNSRLPKIYTASGEPYLMATTYGTYTVQRGNVMVENKERAY
jgi:alanine racemase